MGIIVTTAIKEIGGVIYAVVTRTIQGIILSIVAYVIGRALEYALDRFEEFDRVAQRWSDKLNLEGF